MRILPAGRMSISPLGMVEQSKSDATIAWDESQIDGECVTRRCSTCDRSPPLRRGTRRRRLGHLPYGLGSAPPSERQSQPLAGFSERLGVGFAIGALGCLDGRIVRHLFIKVGRRNCFLDKLIKLLSQQVAIPFEHPPSRVVTAMKSDRTEFCGKGRAYVRPDIAISIANLVDAVLRCGNLFVDV